MTVSRIIGANALYCRVDYLTDDKPASAAGIHTIICAEVNAMTKDYWPSE
jgi:hypothetical protein